jgi:2-keto-3-deoxy-L-rhamnonate aldolase RhmA
LEAFRNRLRQGEPQFGTFLKTASHQTVEVLGKAGLDFIVIDAEHAPFGIETIDRMIVGAAAAGLPRLVRLPELSAPVIGACLDAGADGILAPHVRDEAKAAACVAAAKFAPKQRGVSPSPRAGGYGTLDVATYLRTSDERTTVWCQIEDAEALDRLDAIAATDGVDCLFIGRTDLMISLGVGSTRDRAVEKAVRDICAAGERHGTRIGIFIAKPEETAELKKLGITIFVCGSDQSLLLEGARSARARGLGDAGDQARHG